MPSMGRAMGSRVPVCTTVLAEVLFGLLDAGEDLFEQSFVLRLLAILQHQCQIRQSCAGPAAACPIARGGAMRCLDGFMAESVCGLMASLQELVIFHLDNRHIF